MRHILKRIRHRFCCPLWIKTKFNTHNTTLRYTTLHTPTRTETKRRTATKTRRERTRKLYLTRTVVYVQSKTREREGEGVRQRGGRQTERQTEGDRERHTQ